MVRDPRDPSPIDRDDVMAALGCALRPAAAPVIPGEGRLADAVARVEKANIEAALRRARGVKSHAARILGISRPTLNKKMADFKIDIWSRARPWPRGLPMARSTSARRGRSSRACSMPSGTRTSTAVAASPRRRQV